MKRTCLKSPSHTYAATSPRQTFSPGCKGRDKPPPPPSLAVPARSQRGRRLVVELAATKLVEAGMQPFTSRRQVPARLVTGPWIDRSPTNFVRIGVVGDWSTGRWPVASSCKEVATIPYVFFFSFKKSYTVHVCTFFLSLSLKTSFQK